MPWPRPFLKTTPTFASINSRLTGTEYKCATIWSVNKFVIVEYEWRCLDRSGVESFCGKSQEARRLVPPMPHASYAHENLNVVRLTEGEIRVLEIFRANSR